jgi:hypothetical protein
MVELKEHRLVLVARLAAMVGVRKGVTVPSLSSSQRRLQHPIGGLLRASTLHEVQGDKPRVAWVEGVSWG